jgi:prevent-host-death family protein
MITENIYAAKTNLSKLIEKVLEGEEVVIAKAGKPVVRLVRYEAEPKPVTYGTLRGRVRMAEDFDEYSQAVAEMFADYEPGDQ